MTGKAFSTCRPCRRRRAYRRRRQRLRQLLVVFLDVGDQSFGGEHQAGDGRGVLQSEASDLGWVDYARLDHVAELSGVRVEAEVIVLGFANAADDHSAFVAGVVARSAAWALRERASRC